MQTKKQIVVSLRELLILAHDTIGHLDNFDEIKIINFAETAAEETLAIKYSDISVCLENRQVIEVRMPSKIYPSDEEN